MSDPRLTQTNCFGRNDRGAQIGHLENFFNFSMHGGPSGSEDGNDVEVENRCLRSLAFGQIYMDRLSGGKVPGTGDWALKNETYKAWQHNGGILWIKGRAGCGKSMLINHLSSEAKRQALEPSSQTVLSHFFVFGKGESLQRSPAGLFRGLLHQILAVDRSHLTRFTKATNFAVREKQQGQAGIAWDWASSELQEQLNDVCKLQFCQPGKACLYIDCLDACSDEDATEILEWLISLTSEIGNGFQICFSSRPYPKWKFNKLMCLNLEELNQSDMISYLDFHLKKLQKPSLRGNAVKEEDLLLIKDRLLDRASSVFQWLKYAIRQVTELLKGGEPVRYVLDILANCPQDLDDVYASIVEQIPRQETDVAFRLLEWITLAQAPLPVEDLRHAICVDRPYKKGASIDELRTSNKHWCENDDLLVSRAERLTRGLVRLQNIKLMDLVYNFDNQEVEIRVLQYDHDSVLEFFGVRGLQILASRMETCFTLSRSHLHLAQRCLAYLLTKEGISTAIKEGRARYARDLKRIVRGYAAVSESDHFPRDFLQAELERAETDDGEAVCAVAQPLLTKYAITYWKEHYSVAELDDSVVDECLTVLLSVSTPDMWRIIASFTPDLDEKSTRRLETHDSVVDVICLMGIMGFVHTLEKFLSRPFYQSKPTMMPDTLRGMLNKEGPHGHTPLIAAIRARHHSVVELLLQHGVSANVSDGRGKPPLYYAVQTGQADVVDLLLASPHVDPDERGNMSYSPLMLALECAVIHRGAEESRILESLVQSTRQSVHSSGNPMVSPADRPIQNMPRKGWPYLPSFTPLATAWLNASKDDLAILLKSPLIDSCAQNEEGSTLAHHIARLQFAKLPVESMKDLIEKSRILFDSGRIALDTKDCRGNTPLAVAVKAGGAHTAGMLLAKQEVDANSKDNHGLTPLLVASQDGKVEILKILLASERVNRYEVDNKGRNALTNAVISGVFQAVRLLMSTGQFNPHEQPVGGVSPVSVSFFLAQDPNQDRKAERIGIREFLIRS